MHAVLFAIARQGFELAGSIGVEHWQQAVLRRDGMIHHGERELRTPHFAPGGFQPGECLRGSSFVNQMSVDINDGGLPGNFAHQMRVPDFFKQGTRSHTVGSFHLRGVAPAHKPEFFVPAINHCNKSEPRPPIDSGGV